MDRLAFTALNALSVTRDTRVTQAQNLANMNVPGYRRDMSNESSTQFLEAAGALGARAFQMEHDYLTFSSEAGEMTRTDQELDIAIADQGYFFIQPENGEPALSRRGDLRIDGDSLLRNGAGHLILGADMAPISVPPFRSLRITDLGEIHIEQANGAGEMLVGTVATVIPDEGVALTKGLDAQIRTLDGGVPIPNQRAEVLQGVLEGSNVNVIEEMLSNIETQRSFEFGMRMIQNASELDEAGARLMQAPSG